jgi:GcrA cell cycle regulator
MNIHKDKPWDHREAESLTEMWKKGLSGGEIAKVLNRTRNAVIGKVHRLGLSRDDKNVRETIKQRGFSQARARAEAKAAAKIAAKIAAKFAQLALIMPARPLIETVYEPGAFARPFLTRKFEECAFPVSGAGADTFSCCAPTGGHPRYCKTHREIMYQKAYPPRKKA